MLHIVNIVGLVQMFIKLDLGKEKVCSIEREGIITVIDQADFIEIGLMMGWINGSGNRT